MKKGIFRNFAKFTTKHLYQNIFFNKVAGLPKHLRATASGLVKPCLNSDLYFISKTCGATLLETTVSYKPLARISQENRKTLLAALLDTSAT